jgi:hypothetical protein
MLFGNSLSRRHMAELEDAVSPDDAADMGIREWPQQLKKAGS